MAEGKRMPRESTKKKPQPGTRIGSSQKIKIKYVRPVLLSGIEPEIVRGVCEKVRDVKV